LLRPTDTPTATAQVVRVHRGEVASTVPVSAENSWLILDRLGIDAQADWY